MNRIDIVARNYKRRIASLLLVREGASLPLVLTQVFSSIERFWLLYEEHESRYDIDLAQPENALILTPRRHKGKGRPHKAAMRGFISDLVTIYERATGERIGRTVNAYAPNGNAEKAHPFLATCIAAAATGAIKEDDMSYSRAFVKNALEELHPNPKLGRPAQKVENARCCNE